MKPWVGLVSLGLVALSGLLIIGGAVHEAAARQRVAHQYPLVGKMIDVGGHRLQLEKPTTVIAAIRWVSGQVRQ